LEHNLKSVHLFLKCFPEYNNIIKVDKADVVGQAVQYHVHQALEDAGTGGEAKRHHRVPPAPAACDEGGLVSVTLSHRDIVVPCS
jgi:hypothetical protein